MLENVQFILHEECRLDPKKPILVGVSGGPDSLCLLGVLREAGYRLIVAHFNHNLRPESEEEAQSVEKTAAQFKIRFVTDSKDVRAYAKEQGLSIEEAARNLRYQFLFAQAQHLKAQAVAVGHTSDDQVETVLMHFIRGAGLSGLKGMTFRTLLPKFDPKIPLVRPLLDVWRDQTVTYCSSHDLRPHYDPSNESFDFLRSRVRHELIPMLETYNPRFREAVWRSVQSLSTDHALINETLQSSWAAYVRQETENYILLDVKSLAACSIGLQRNLIRRSFERLLPGQEMIYAMVEQARAFIRDSASNHLDLAGGLVLLREGDTVYVARSDQHLPKGRWPQMPANMDSVALSLPGQALLSDGWRFSAEEWRLPALAWEQSSLNNDHFQVWLDANGLPEKFELRVRRPGDIFEPLGMKGHSQKLSDFFTNVKLPQRARDRWPLLLAGDKVIWVPGYRPAEPFRLSQTSRRILYFSLVHPPEEVLD
jgi:tRNA(Ile)-lysidine synthase